MFQTNRIPTGFLDLVGAETGGKTPPRYADTLMPQVDLTELYLAQTLSGATLQPSSVAAGQVETIEVPADEAWLLRSMSVDCAIGTTGGYEQWAFWLGSLPRGGPTAASAVPMLWVTDLLTIEAVGLRYADAFTLPEPILLLPGVQIEASNIQRSGHAAVDVNIRYGFNRLQ